MAKVTVEGNILAIQLSLFTKIAGHTRHFRIPLVLVRSASVEAQPYQMLSEMDTLPEMPHAPPGSPASDPRDDMKIARIPIFNISGGFLVGWHGPDSSKVFAHVWDGRPALRVDIDMDAWERLLGPGPFGISGFLVTVHDPESTAAEIRAALG
jgi:hypothetical protein